jgi:sugar-specific transcriptional regulator TrmB
MTSNGDGDSTRRTTDHLEHLGLSAYAARTFVALSSLGDGTAKEVSEAADVPRTRVYDAADELHELGLVRIESSTPRRFHAVPNEVAMQLLSSEYTTRIDEAFSDLEAISGTESSVRRSDLWQLSEEQAIVDRTVRVLDETDETLFFATGKTAVDDAIVDSLVAATERGVSVQVAGVPAPVDDRLQSTRSDVERQERPWELSRLPIATLVVADGRHSLLAVDTDEPLAFWSADEPNGLLSLVRALLEVPQ